MLPASPRLSPIAYDILNINQNGYREFVVRGDGNMAAHGKLSATDPSQLVNDSVKDPDMARALACSLWLWHDWLDESHRIAQGIHTETGSFWHAIMHRREGDFSNSKYWLARCRNHPVRRAIGNQASVVLGGMPADTRLLRLISNDWNAEYFVDLVEENLDNRDPDMAEILVVLQQLEWRVLTEYCASMA